ncbi:MAG: hypothetical protein WDO74_26890 [Pseudomonadota bacterium]
MGRCIFWACLLAGLPSCGGGDDSSPNGTLDAATIAAAPQSTKNICERVCTAADQIRSAGCGTTEFSSHAECYAQCVSRYLSHAKCKDAFDESNNCIIDAGCSAQTQCIGQIIFAAACLQSG